MKIRCAAGTEYELHHFIPDHLWKYRIPHAFPFYVFGPWGEMLFQKIRSRLGTAWDNLYLMKHNATFTSWMNISITELHTNMLNHFECILNNKKILHTKAGYGGLAYEPEVHNVATFEGGKIYHNFDAHLYRSKLQEFADAHPGLYELLNRAEHKVPRSIPRMLKLDGEIRMLIHHLKKPDCAPALLPKYINGKMEELLMTALWQMDRKDPDSKIIITPELIEKAKVAEAYMREHINEHIDYTVFAQKAETNLNYLKIAFKAEFRYTMNVYFRKLKMQTASQLLLSDPQREIKDIGSDVGYYSPTDFARAFKAEFGCLPSQFRKTGMGTDPKKNPHHF